MRVKVYNNKNIRLQGLTYYDNCYKYWDLNHCKDAYENEYFDRLLQINLKHGLHNANLPMSLIKLQKYSKNFNNYYDKLSPSIKRDINISKKNNFYFKPYNFNHHIQDFSEINLSQKKIKDNVNPWYLKPIEYFKGSHSGYRHEWEDELHFSQWYGVFKYFKHYKQGELTTNEKLFAYCKVAYEGELATVHLIWAHVDFRNKGLMFYLIINVVKEVMKNSNVKYLMYGNSLQKSASWKHRMLFEPEKFTVVL